MAGRIRSIKPELLEDDKAAELSDVAWRLWVSSWCIADDHGRFRAGAAFLHAQAFWGRPRPVDQVAGAVDELAAAGLITLYQVNGQKYAFVTNWGRHQRVDNAGKPRCPGPEDGSILREPPRTSATHGEPPQVSASLRGSPPDHRPPTTISEDDHEHEGELEGDGARAAPAPASPARVCEFNSAEGTRPNGNGHDPPRPARRLKPKPSAMTPDEAEGVTDVLGKLSKRAGVEFSPQVTAHVEHVLARLRDGHSPLQLRTVVWHQANEWEGDERMRRYLRPSTLFDRAKFAEYLPQAEAAWAEDHRRNGRGNGAPRGDPPVSEFVTTLLRQGDTG